jgi:hypothetical protein
MSNTCKCGQPLVFAVTPKGAHAPICAEATDDGNVLLLRSDALRVVLAITLTGDLLELARARSVPLRLNHFADCPDRKDFKR